MQTIYTVAFFGHRYIDDIDKVEEALFNHISALVKENDYVEFLVGRNGEFDQCVSSVIRHIRKRLDYDNCIHKLVLPYPTAEYLNNKDNFEEYYDGVFIYDPTYKIYPKAVIGMRNTEMVDAADLIICYIEKNSGGAYKAVKYAKKQGKKIINIFEY